MKIYKISLFILNRINRQEICGRNLCLFRKINDFSRKLASGYAQLRFLKAEYVLVGCAGFQGKHARDAGQSRINITGGFYNNRKNSFFPDFGKEFSAGMVEARTRIYAGRPCC